VDVLAGRLLMAAMLTSTAVTDGEFGTTGLIPGEYGAAPGTWTGRVRGRFRGVFDSPKIDEGGQIFRAAD